MRGNLSFPRLFAALLMLAVWQSGVTAPDDAPVVQTELLHSSLVAVAAVDRDLNIAERYELLAPVVKETHDLALMGRSTVRRYWREWSDEQRRAFLDAFERLSITTYASRFQSVSAGMIEILSSETADDDSSEAEVKALIHRADGDPVALDYDLEFSDDSWRIVQIYANGVSDLSLMRSEYYEILGTGGFDELIAAIEADIAAL